nr:MAG TPA: hypothetical protein [Caudoviricetes sp.]
MLFLLKNTIKIAFLVKNFFVSPVFGTANVVI